MKKRIAMLTAVALIATLTGCGTSGADNTVMSGEIKVYTRDASSGTREAFEKAGDFEDQMTLNVVEVSSNGDMATKVGKDQYAIGYVSLSTDFDANNITPVSFEGVAPSKTTVLDGTYQMQRPFSFVTRASGDFESDEKEQLITAFLDYLQNSVEGMQIVEKAGGVVDVAKGSPWAELKKKHPIVEQNNSAITIRTAGSTSVDKTIKAALEAFQAEAGQFQISMNQSGSGDGYKRVLGSEKDGANAADIGFASRSFNADEDVTMALHSGQYCIDAVVTVVNKDNTAVQSLTQEQVKSIFTGEVTKWGAVK